VFSTRPPEISMPDAGLDVLVVPSPRLKGVEKTSGALMAALHQSAWPRYDIAHWHAFGPAAFAILPKLRGIRIVTQGHGIEWLRSRWGSLGRFFLRTLEGPSVRLADALTVVSQTQVKYVQTTYDRRATYIPPGVDYPPQRAEPRAIRDLWGLVGGDYLLFASRLVPEKGAHLLLEAYRSIVTDVRLVVAGNAPDEGTYLSVLKDVARTDPRVLFVGWATGEVKAELLSNCVAFVQPSDVEGLSIGLLEAMSYGRPCVISDIPENIEATGSDAISFRAGDAADLRRALATVLELSQAQANAIGKRLANRVAHDFAWDSVASRLEALYEKVL
jgi:glycosyltransferase involved in cell wall biosynthesis